MESLIIIGGGLSGCEAAWQAAQRGLSVKLFEMRPILYTGAHTSSYLAELVCSNSLGSNLLDRPSGLLKEEIRRLDSLLLNCAEESAIPAGGALAVDREAFAGLVTSKISTHPNIQVIRQEVTDIPDGPVIIASGPLTSPRLSAAIAGLTGRDHLFFFDAIAPIVTLSSIDMSIAFRASRYDRGSLAEGDYINCPLSKQQYQDFYAALLAAECRRIKGFRGRYPARGGRWCAGLFRGMFAGRDTRSPRPGIIDFWTAASGGFDPPLDRGGQAVCHCSAATG